LRIPPNWVIVTQMPFQLKSLVHATFSRIIPKIVIFKQFPPSSPWEGRFCSFRKLAEEKQINPAIIYFQFLLIIDTNPSSLEFHI
jgi:hypothetical protein